MWDGGSTTGQVNLGTLELYVSRLAVSVIPAFAAVFCYFFLNKPKKCMFEFTQNFVMLFCVSSNVVILC